MDGSDGRQIATFVLQLLDHQLGPLCDALLQTDVKSESEASTLWVIFSTALLTLHRILLREKQAVDIETWLRYESLNLKPQGI